ncbi:putative feruloyl esterase B-1 [Daldinia childiae]|uniref:putative feruloyl esterase B-1 n=1 Tax=Daldinia childiae TaxID=326645 RepID=UPI001444FD8C|nr:putative feruloyl esterase B-1 [Daldinia childiae]KAF3062125.1 putative feruloyl esterase B-1 [Daldinia childiae]
MYLRKSQILGYVLALTPQASHAYPGTKPKCSLDNVAHQLSSINSSLSNNATILSVTRVQLNGSYGDPNSPQGLPPLVSTGLPDLCAVEVNVTSSESSSYTISIFLPSKWNSRFLATGGGGTGGYVNYLDMGVGSQYGFATMSTDNGHRGSPYDVEWAYKSPQKLIDWGWRAMHGSVELSKQLIKGYYGENIQYSYYTGCSTGGRQGLKEAQVGADSFDGMLIGAPAWWISHQVAWNTKISKDYYPVDDPKSISNELFSSIIAQTVVDQCDAIDGVKDGIISDPENCHPDFEVLSCNSTAANSSACLTSLQLETLAKIYEDYYIGSEFVHPGLELSSEPGWPQYLFAGTPTSWGIDYIRYIVFEDLNWPLDEYNSSVYERLKNLEISHEIDADQFDMSPYRDHGGKILMYHGLSDPLIVTRGSSHFYEQVELATGEAYPITDWFRLFFVPGMLHCSDSPPGVDAPWHINGAGQNWQTGSGAYSVPGFQDSKHDALLALMEWVEGGKAVDQIIATAWHDSTDPSSGVWKQRPICPHPKTAKYNGVGDVNKALNWDCA